MQRQYVAHATVNFSDFKFFVRPGDVCKHNEITNDFIIYRNGELVANLKVSTSALTKMMSPETKYFSLSDTSAVETQKPEAPKPEAEVEIEEGSISDLADIEEEVEMGGMEAAAEKGVTITQVDLNEEAPEGESSEKIKDVVEAQKAKGRKAKNK